MLPLRPWTKDLVGLLAAAITLGSDCERVKRQHVGDLGLKNELGGGAGGADFALLPLGLRVCASGGREAVGTGGGGVDGIVGRKANAGGGEGIILCLE